MVVEKLILLPNRCFAIIVKVVVTYRIVHELVCFLFTIQRRTNSVIEIPTYVRASN